MRKASNAPSAKSHYYWRGSAGDAHLDPLSEGEYNLDNPDRHNRNGDHRPWKHPNGSHWMLLDKSSTQVFNAETGKTWGKHLQAKKASKAVRQNVRQPNLQINLGNRMLVGGGKSVDIKALNLLKEEAPDGEFYGRKRWHCSLCEEDYCFECCPEPGISTKQSVPTPPVQNPTPAPYFEVPVRPSYPAPRQQHHQTHICDETAMLCSQMTQPVRVCLSRTLTLLNSWATHCLTASCLPEFRFWPCLTTRFCTGFNKCLSLLASCYDCASTICSRAFLTSCYANLSMLPCLHPGMRCCARFRGVSL